MNGKLNVIHNIAVYHLFTFVQNLISCFDFTNQKSKWKQESKIAKIWIPPGKLRLSPTNHMNSSYLFGISGLVNPRFTRFDFLFLHILVTLMEANLSAKMQMCPTAIHMI